MTRLLSMTAVALLAIGCAKPAEAPAEVTELPRFLFENLDSETGEELVVGIEALEAEWLMHVDLDGNTSDRSITPPVLLPEHLGDIAYPTNVDPQLQVPVATAGRSIHDVQAHIDLQLEENWVCIGGNTTVYSNRTFQSDPDCWSDGTCDRIEVRNEIRKETIVADVWYDMPAMYRTLELSDGRTAMIGRQWLEKQYLADDPDKSWDQVYVLDVWWPMWDDPSQTARAYAVWSSLTSPAPESLYLKLVMDGIPGGYANADAFISGESCDLDRDRPYDRPQD